MESSQARSSQALFFSDRGCPYAHRVLSMLAQLGVQFEHHEAPTHQRPAGLSRWSPSGRIPLLVLDDLVLSESAVMLGHLAEAYEFEQAWPRALDRRSWQRDLMSLVDLHVAPAILSGHGSANAARLNECLDGLEAVCATTPPEPHVLSFHLAPLWHFVKCARPDGLVAQGIHSRPALTAWLDAASRLDAVSQTAVPSSELRRMMP